MRRPKVVRLELDVEDAWTPVQIIIHPKKTKKFRMIEVWIAQEEDRLTVRMRRIEFDGRASEVSETLEMNV